MFSDSKKFVGEGLTYDDVLLVPAYSEIIPRDVRVNSMFSRNIAVNILVKIAYYPRAKLPLVYFYLLTTRNREKYHKLGK